MRCRERECCLLVLNLVSSTLPTKTDEVQTQFIIARERAKERARAREREREREREGPGAGRRMRCTDTYCFLCVREGRSGGEWVCEKECFSLLCPGAYVCVLDTQTHTYDAQTHTFDSYTHAYTLSQVHTLDIGREQRYELCTSSRYGAGLWFSLPSSYIV